MASINASVKSLQQSSYFIFLLFTATLGPLLFGYHLGELNAPADVITCRRKSISILAGGGLPQCIPMKSAEFGLVQSIFTLGGLIGALAAGPLSSRRGRLFAMRINTLPMVLGPFVSALSPNAALLSVGRLLSGLGAGASLVVVPIYISEIAPTQSRGFYGSFTQIMTNVGIFIAQLIGFWLSHDFAWRVILGVAGCIAALRAGFLFFAVESPKWLFERGRGTESRSVLYKLRGTDEGIDEEIDSWKSPNKKASTAGSQDSERQGLLTGTDEDAASQSKSAESSSDLSFIQVIRSSRYRPAILAILLVMFSQQLTGINSIVMYGVSILTSLLSSSSALLNIGVSALNIIATTAFAPLIDNPRLGRRGCLLLSISGMTVSSLLLGIGMRASIKVLSAICVLTFVASFALGLGPVPFLLASELVDTKGVSATQSWALAGNWIATFLVAQFFPILNEALGKGVTYFIFAGLGVAFFVLVGWFVPETRGKNGMADVWGREEDRAEHEE